MGRYSGRQPTGALGLIGILVIATIGGVAACDPGHGGLRGTWVGEDYTGIPITLTFGSGNAFAMTADGEENPLTLPDDVRLEYEAISDLEPARLSVRIIRGDSLLGKVPMWVYRREGRRLILCNVRTHHETLGGISLGISHHEWPEDLSGDCSVLER